MLHEYVVKKRERRNRMKSTRKALALLLCAAMVMSSTACGRARAEKPGTATKTEEAPIPITILTRPNFELEANTLRDQLTKAGFEVTVNVQPDRASSLAVQESGKYDINILNWLTDAARRTTR